MKTRDGSLLSTEDLDESAVIVIIASGLPEWLLKGSPSSKSFYASPHAVPSLVGSLQSRSVFARMKVSPGWFPPSSQAGCSRLFLTTLFPPHTIRHSLIFSPASHPIAQRICVPSASKY